MAPDRVSGKPLNALVDHAVGRRGRLCVRTQREDAFPSRSCLPRPCFGKVDPRPTQSNTMSLSVLPNSDMSAVGQSELPRINVNPTERFPRSFGIGTETDASPTIRIPIPDTVHRSALLPGRNGFQPQLSLVYSKGSGNGRFGMGRGLSVPGVSRKTSKGVPFYDDVEDLVPVEELEARTRYRRRTAGLFARIDHHHDADNDYWEVRSKDGLVGFYGTSRPDPPPQDWSDPAVIRDPDPLKPRHIFAWKLTRTADPFGNRIEYLYERDPVQTDGPHQLDQLYPSEILYVDYGDSANPQFLVTVRFLYENRPDAFSDYRSGFEIRTVRRCTRIEIPTHPGVDILTRTYQLYLDQRVQQGRLSQEQLPLNGASLLNQIQVIGHEGDRTKELPPLEFGYSRFEPEGREFFAIQGTDLPARSLASGDLELADLFGNGLPDILEMIGTVPYWRNLGGGRFALPREMRDAPAGLRLADQGVQLIDANGDGQIDLLVTTETMSGYYPLRFGGLWDRRSFQR